MSKLLKILLSLSIIMCSSSVWSINRVSIKKETPAYSIYVAYPQGFKDPRINATVQDFIEKTKKNFLKESTADTKLPAEVPGKSELTITYSLPYKLNSALSVRFMVSIFHRGAAHPSNTVTVLNFINGRQIQLADLFRAEKDFLKPIAKLCTKKITEKKISDEKWIEEGTKPISKNYQIWAFSPKGIDIIFDTYQVAAYVYGPQTVVVPLSQLTSLVKPEVMHRVWGY